MTNNNKMATKPMLPLIISMALPPLCSMFMQYTYNFVDCIFVSWISEDALTAVSLSFPITTLMIALSIWLGVGINVLIAKALGAGKPYLADSVVTHGLIISSVVGTALIIILLIIIKPYFLTFVDDPIIYDSCLEYMYICAFFQLPNMVHIAIQKIIQGTGNMLSPMLFQMAGVVLNFILDPILIFGIGFFPEMGVKGAAVSTLAGYTFSMLLAFYVLLCTKQKVKIKTKGFKIDWETFRDIIVIGLPSFIMNALGAFMVTFANIFLIGYSTTAVAFFGAYFKAQQMIVMTVNGLIQGCIPIMSFNYGAKDKNRLQQAFNYGTTIAVVIMGFGALLLWVFPEVILRIFMASQEMISFGVPAMRIMAISYVFNGIATMVASYMQSCGMVRYSIIINILRQLGLLLPAMWILTSLMGMSGVWYAFIVAEVLTCIYCAYVYKKNHI
ncbi:MAG: MATE family efflux transporter [Clostridiales bacterium]|nr:MATE family efflux transporter [Clostridiales bacterium]